MAIVLQRRERIDRVLHAALAAAAFVALRHLPACPLLRMLDVPCPLCGGRHAIDRMMLGDLAVAMAWNPAAVAWAVAGAAMVAGWISEAAFGRRFISCRVERMVVLTLCGATLASWGLRLSGAALPYPPP